MLIDTDTYNGPGSVFVDVDRRAIFLRDLREPVTNEELLAFMRTQWCLDPFNKRLASYPFPFKSFGDQLRLANDWRWGDIESLAFLSGFVRQQ